MKERAGALATPILMLQAGKDEVVEVEGQNIVCSKAQKCRKIVFDSSRHEILNEKDSIRNQALQHILQFITSPAS
jgi:lysophospholipase